MPELTRFQGIIIQMYFEKGERHFKPHMHVSYAEHEAVVSVDGELMEGTLPRKQMRLVEAWAIMREEELYKAWYAAVRNEDPGKIAPLN
jgi:hypothetical protein